MNTNAALPAVLPAAQLSSPCPTSPAILSFAAPPCCSYEVRKKKKGCVDEVAELILEKFTNRLNVNNKRSWSVQVGAADVAANWGARGSMGWAACCSAC